MKSIDLKKYYPHPLHEGENTVIFRQIKMEKNFLLFQRKRLLLQ